MNKLLTKIVGVALGASMAIGVGVAVVANSGNGAKVAEADDSLAYTITFKDSGNASDGTAAKTALNDLISDGSDYVASISTASYVYQAKSGCGVKLGSGNYAGVLELTLSSQGQKKATKVVYELAAANDTGKTIKLSVNGKTSGTGYTTYTTGSTAGSFANAELAWDGSTALTKIKVDTTAKKFRTYLKTIKVYTAPQGTSYSVTNSISNATLSSTAAVAENDPLNITIIPDSHFNLPTSLTSVTMGGSTLTAGSGYTYNSSTGAFSIAKVTGNVVITGACVEDAKYTVTYVAGDHGTGSDYVVNNQYAGSYTLATFTTAGFSANSGYAFKKWNVGGTEYAEGASITLNANTTVTALYDEVTAYTLVTNASDLVEGTQFILLHASTNSMAIGGWSSSYFTTVSTASVSGSQAVCEDAMVFTLEGSSGAWNVKCDDYYYGLQNSTTALRSASASGDNYSWTISITNGIASMKTAGSGTRSLCYNSSATRYSAYTASSTYTEVRMFAIIPEVNELDSVTTSGQATLFTAGNKWSYGGTLTAHYTIEDDATVTPTSFKFGASGINPTTAGTAITTNTTLDHDTHNGKYIYVVYTEDDITKWASYQITVNYAPVTSVVIDTHTAEIGLNETYNYNLVGVTVNTQYAQQGYEWVVSANTVNDDYEFDGSGLLSGDTEGTITLRCRSTSDNSKYDELVVTVSGDPFAEFTPSSVSGYVGKSISVEFTYTNMDDESLISVSSSNTSAITIGEIITDEGDGLVTINFVGAGSSTLSISYDGGSALDTVTATASNDSVVALNWTASNIKVYSGAVLPVAIEDTWMVNYEMASGDSDYITYGDYSVKLGNSTITLPHTWSAADDGKALCVEYMGFASSTVTVDVTQTLRPVYAATTESNTVSWTATAAANLGSQISSQGGTDEGTISTGSFEWNYTRTLVGLASNKSDYISFQGNTWIQLGSGNALESIEFTTSAIPGNIKSVSVVAATAGAHTLTIDVGGTKYLEDESLHVYTGTAAAANPDPDDCVKTGTGSSSGAITITIAQSGSTKKAMVIRSISVTYETGSSEEVNIANVAGHEAAQKAVVKFAKAFNAAMDTTSGCTTNMDSAWTTASGAWTTFLSEAAALGEAEEAYAKKLVKNATAQWTEDTDSDYEYCLERAMATYEKCVADYGMNPFMTPVRTLPSSSSHISGYLSGINSSNVYAIAITMSMITFTVVGGYFFLRKKKKEN